jgi:hypothetical protein
VHGTWRVTGAAGLECERAGRTSVAGETVSGLISGLVVVVVVVVVVAVVAVPLVTLHQSLDLWFASRSVTLTPSNSFCGLLRRSSWDSRSVLDIVLIVSEASFVGFQSMGHRTPCRATA